MPIPILLVGDAPGFPTGGSRIATDLGWHLWNHREALGIDLAHVGAQSRWELPLTGLPLKLSVPWPTWVHSDQMTWGMPAAQHILGSWAGSVGPGAPGVVLLVMDPGRAYEYLRMPLPKGWRRWGYLSVDGENRNGTISGPAGEAIKAMHRLLAYGPYGARVMGKVTGREVEWLPHGYHPDIFTPQMSESDHSIATRHLNPTGSVQQVIGCVAANHARKDIGLFCETLAELPKTVRGWLHIDQEVAEAWSIPQLAKDCGLGWERLSVTTTMTDRELACCYALAAMTIAVGRGEGFGYPILESQACGTPCYHVNYAGGADLTPDRLAVDSWQLTGPYAMRRPIVNPRAVAERLAEEFQLIAEDAEAARVYREATRQRVAPYQWPTLWPRWEEWLRAGLTEMGGTGG